LRNPVQLPASGQAPRSALAQVLVLGRPRVLVPLPVLAGVQSRKLGWQPASAPYLGLAHRRRLRLAAPLGLARLQASASGLARRSAHLPGLERRRPSGLAQSRKPDRQQELARLQASAPVRRSARARLRVLVPQQASGSRLLKRQAQRRGLALLQAAAPGLISKQRQRLPPVLWQGWAQV